MAATGKNCLNRRLVGENDESKTSRGASVGVDFDYSVLLKVRHNPGKTSDQNG